MSNVATAILAEPKVLNVDMVRALHIVNRTVRWLRSNRQKAISIDIRAARPTLTVPPGNLDFLIAAGHGFNARPFGDGHKLCSVIVDGCAIQWTEWRRA
ncbi:hypothetical protein ACO0LO_01930 [Undibacterium sp. TJN25]|uniref:hypothetical protein n=1 Tax=Undibacterium sp. TJN25 TaxID=3413056 RepID=UPI003BF14555